MSAYSAVRVRPDARALIDMARLGDREGPPWELWPVPDRPADYAKSRGLELVYRLVSNEEEGRALLAGLAAGNPAEGFRAATVRGGQSKKRKVADIERAEKRGAVPVFTSPYPTVAELYAVEAPMAWGDPRWQNPQLLLAIMFDPRATNNGVRGLIYQSSRTGQTQSYAYSAVFPDAEYVIDARAVREVYVLSPSQMEMLADYLKIFHEGYTRGSYANAFKDKDARLMKANLEASINLLPPQRSLGRPFSEVPMALPNGLEVSQGDRAILADGQVVTLAGARFFEDKFAGFEVRGWKPILIGRFDPLSRAMPADWIMEVVPKGQRVRPEQIERARSQGAPIVRRYFEGQRAQWERYLADSEASGDAERAERLRESLANLAPILEGLGMVDGEPEARPEATYPHITMPRPVPYEKAVEQTGNFFLGRDGKIYPVPQEGTRVNYGPKNMHVSGAELILRRNRIRYSSGYPLTVLILRYGILRLVIDWREIVIEGLVDISDDQFSTLMKLAALPEKWREYRPRAFTYELMDAEATTVVRGEGFENMIEEITEYRETGRPVREKFRPTVRWSAAGDVRPEATPGPEPWQLLPSDMLSADEYYERLRANYFDSQGRKIASSREKPTAPLDIPIGTWKIDPMRLAYGREIEQLRLLDPDQLKMSENLVEHNYGARGDDAKRYAQWLREGKSPPPISVLERHNGWLVVTDGHRRVAAAKQAGVQVPAWVSPAAESGKIDYEGRPILVGLTWELAVRDAMERGLPVPDRVRREYEQSAKPPEVRARVYYHGTSSAFDEPDPGKFDKDGMYGPGYYLTSEPRVAEAYSKSRSAAQDAQQELDEAESRVRASERVVADLRDWIANASDVDRPDMERVLVLSEDTLRDEKARRDAIMQKQEAMAGPSIRAVDVPGAITLLDTREHAPGAIERVLPHLKDWEQPALKAALEDPVLSQRGITGQDVYERLRGIANGATNANRILAKAGYDGIRYGGGQIMPIKDDQGMPVEHDVVVIFPESLHKITNVYSGARGQVADECGCPIVDEDPLDVRAVDAGVAEMDRMMADMDRAMAALDTEMGGMGLLAGGAVGRASYVPQRQREHNYNQGDRISGTYHGVRFSGVVRDFINDTKAYNTTRLWVTLDKPIAVLGSEPRDMLIVSFPSQYVRLDDPARGDADLRPYTAEQIKDMGRTSRPKGIGGNVPKTVQLVESIARPGESILDYGAGGPREKGGPVPSWTEYLRDRGLDVDFYDLFFFPREEALAPGLRDITFASSVLNVQPSRQELDDLLDLLASTLKPTGRLVVNFPGPPGGPRNNDYTGADVRRLLEERFSRVERVAGDEERPFFVASGPRAMVRPTFSKGSKEPWEMTKAEFLTRDTAPGLAFPNKLYHGTTATYEGVPLPSLAQQWGEAVYLATDPTLPREEFGFGGRVLEFYGDFRRPLYVNSPEFDALAGELMARRDALWEQAQEAEDSGDYGRYDELRTEARRFDLDDDGAGPAFGDLARSRGYDAIIDPEAGQYGAEVAVLDNSTLKTPGQMHREMVQRALAAGRPVPPEVLADYPDLAARPDTWPVPADATPEQAATLRATEAAALACQASATTPAEYMACIQRHLKGGA